MKSLKNFYEIANRGEQCDISISNRLRSTLPYLAPRCLFQLQLCVLRLCVRSLDSDGYQIRRIMLFTALA